MSSPRSNIALRKDSVTSGTAVACTGAAAGVAMGANEALPQIVDCARAGDDAAFAVLFRQHWEELRAFVWRMVRDVAVAEELVQDVFLRICERTDLREPTRVISRAYLYAAARNRAINYLQHRRFATRWSEDDISVELVAGEETPADVTQYHDLAQAARAAVWALPARCREVYILRRDHGLGPEEIAEALGLSVKTVDNHLARALKALRLALAAYTMPVLILMAGGTLIAR